jgi:hypothetical protein
MRATVQGARSQGRRRGRGARQGGEPGVQPGRWPAPPPVVRCCELRGAGAIACRCLPSLMHSGSLSTMKALLQAGPNGRVPLLPEKRFLIRYMRFPSRT